MGCGGREGRGGGGRIAKDAILEAVILEGLRRHPPGYFVLPHSVTQDITFEGYVMPKNASLNFMVS